MNNTIFFKPSKAGIPIKVWHISKRTMMSARCTYALRAAYHVACFVNNSETLHNFNKTNPEPLIKTMMDLALDDNKGIIQHKTAFIKNISNQQFKGDYFYNSYLEKYSTHNITYEKDSLADARILNETRVLLEYFKYFGIYNIKVHVTFDKGIIQFPTANQPNIDFIIELLDHLLGIKITYQDEKSGMDMFKHSSKGTIGIVHYDSNNKNIQMTSKPIEITDIVTYDKRVLKQLQMSLANDNLLQNLQINSAINRARDITNQMADQPFNKVISLHNELQNIYWTKLQSNPQFTRSVSFVFLNKVINDPMTDKETRFAQKFQSKLQKDGMFDLTNRKDYNEIFTAFLYAGKDMDPLFIQKLHYLHQNGFTLNNSLLFVMDTLAKNGIF